MIVPTYARWLAGAAIIALGIAGLGGSVTSQPPGAVAMAEAVSIEPGPVLPIPPPKPADPHKVALGRRLFESNALSHDGKRSCYSCHDTHTNGASPLARDLAPDGTPLPLNTPTVFNAALNFRQGWKGTSRTLEDEAVDSIDDPRVMGSSIPEVLDHVRADSGLVKDFVQAYGKKPDRAALLDAIATYERTLLTPDAPFDRWLKGDAGAISPDAEKGFHLFEQFGCISCHQGVNIGGNLFEEPGIFHPLTEHAPPLLRVPSLRNIAITAPYFHDGSTASLGQAVRNMAHAQLDRTLSHDELAAIVAFLRTLTAPPPPQP